MGLLYVAETPIILSFDPDKRSVVHSAYIRLFD
jgi:hypothetical protein